jgi:hypothetical protein
MSQDHSPPFVLPRMHSWNLLIIFFNFAGTGTAAKTTGPAT